MRYYVSWKCTDYYRKDSLKLSARYPVSGRWPSCFFTFFLTYLLPFSFWEYTCSVSRPEVVRVTKAGLFSFLVVFVYFVLVFLCFWTVKWPILSGVILCRVGRETFNSKSMYERKHVATFTVYPVAVITSHFCLVLSRWSLHCMLFILLYVVCISFFAFFSVGWFSLFLLWTYT